MSGYLEGKSIAVTGAGRGIGRAVAFACAEAGASVVVNDYGVSIDGREPTSAVADEVVAEIKKAGGRAVANANSVATMEGGASIVKSAIDAFGGIGDAEDVAPMVVFLLSDKARQITGQVYTVSGGKIAVWNQPVETRAMFKDGRWTPAEIAARLSDSVGVERMGLIDRLEQMRQAAAKGEKPNAQ